MRFDLRKNYARKKKSLKVAPEMLTMPVVPLAVTLALALTLSLALAPPIELIDTIHLAE